MKKGDLWVIGFLLLSAFTVFTVLHLTGGGGTRVVIYENNALVYEGALSNDKTVTLSSNTVEIRDGQVRMTSAECENQICVRHRAIDKKGGSIICLPNKVVVQIE